MIVGERIKLRLKATSMSQSALARQVGLTQPAINALIRGSTRTSLHLHRIAKALGTTPAYLEGETDDPLADAPDTPFISPEEREVLECLRVMTPADRKALAQIACSMAGRFAKPATFHAPGQHFQHEGDKR